MLSMLIGYLALPNTLEFDQNGAISELCLQQHITGIKVLRGSCCLYCFNPPANFGVAEKIACRVCITFVKIPTHITSLSFAVAGCAFEDMRAIVVFVFNSGGILIEYIYR